MTNETKDLKNRLLLPCLVLTLIIMMGGSVFALSNLGGRCSSSRECVEGYCLNSTCRFPPVLETYNISGACNSTGNCHEGFCRMKQCLIPIVEDRSVFVLAMGAQSGCAGLIENCSGIWCLFCGVTWILLIIGSIAAAFVSRKRGRMLPVIMFALPILAGFLFFPSAGFILAVFEIIIIAFMKKPVTSLGGGGEKLTLPQIDLSKLSLKNLQSISLKDLPNLSLLNLPCFGNVEVKKLDIRGILEFAFSWLTDERYWKLAGVFFIAEILASVAALLATVIVLMVAVALSAPSASASVLRPISAADISGMIGAGLIGIIVQIALALGIIIAFVIWKGWGKDKKFLSLLYMILPFRLAVVLIPLVGALLISVLFGLSLQDWTNLLYNPGISLTSVLSHSNPLLMVAVILVSAATLAAVVVWSFFCSFFIIAKVLEQGGVRMPFTELNESNLREYVKFLLTALFTILFNVLSPRIFYLQVALIAVALVMVLAGPSVPFAPSLFWLAILASIPVVVFNCVRLIAASVLRVFETDDAKDAMAKAWDYSRGYAVPIAMTVVAVFIATAVVTLLTSVPPLILEILSGYVQIFSIPAAVLRAFTGAFGTIVSVFVSVFMGIAIYSQISHPKK